MTIHHLFDREDWYIISHDRSDDRKPRPKWHHHGVWLHGPQVEAHAEWNIFDRGFGVGFQFGRNGGESDVGLNLYLGRLASVWLRLRSPWTKWARVREGKPMQYYARHSGIRLFPHTGKLIDIEIDNLDGYWSRDQPWWRSFGVSRTDILGRNRVERTEIDSGAVRVPMPEGNYDATYKTEQWVRRHVRYPGKARDWFGVQSGISTSVDIPGGIPVEGKGENSYDCGMDGTFGITAPGRVEQVVGTLVGSVQRDRNRYGGPHDLDRPMTVAEAEAPR